MSGAGYNVFYRRRRAQRASSSHPLPDSSSACRVSFVLHCSVLQAFEGIMEVLGTAGDARLGGNDFDGLLAQWLREEERGASGGGGDVEQQQQQQQPEGGQRDWAMAAAEGAKVSLSALGEGGGGDGAVEVALPGGARVALTQQRFEQLTARLFQLMANVLEALGEALFIEWAVKPSDAVPGASSNSSSSSSNSSSLSSGPEEQQQQPQQRGRWAPPPRRITQVALVGQVTRLPSVRQFVQRCTGVAPRVGVDPAEAVALGAAIHAGVLLGEVSGVELMDGSYSQGLHDRATGFSGWQP